MEEPKRFKVWVTKYALTRGMIVSTGEETECPTMIVVVGDDENPVPPHRQMIIHKPYWHTDEESAKDHVRTMVRRKIRSLSANVVKLEKLLASLD